VLYKREMHAGSINAMIIGISQNKERRMPVEIKMVELDGERVLLADKVEEIERETS
jgi:hypothetical protein